MGSARKMLSAPKLWISTGSFALDYALRWKAPGGIPMGPTNGRVIHIFGDPSLGKSVLIDHLVKNTQEIGGYTYVSETEGSRDLHFAEALGVNLDDFFVQPAPDTIEQMFDMGIKYHSDVRKHDKTSPFFWGVDSLETIEAGRTFGVTMSGKQGGVHEYGGGRAGAIGAALRKLAHICALYPTTVVLLNQVRDRPGIMFGDPKKPTGGNAPRFLASAEVKLTSSEYGMIRERNRMTGRWVHARLVKNKMAAPFGEADFVIDFKRGIRPWPGVLEQLEADGIVSVKRNKDKTIAEQEFVVVKTGEVLPLAQFTQWCVQEKMLER
jgi:recombination protein RecA